MGNMVKFIPTDDRRGFRLTELLIQGTRLMNMQRIK